MRQITFGDFTVTTCNFFVIVIHYGNVVLIPIYIYIPLSHLRSKSKASAYMLCCTGSGMLTRYTHCSQCNIKKYCTDHSAYISLQHS